MPVYMRVALLFALLLVELASLTLLSFADSPDRVSESIQALQGPDRALQQRAVLELTQLGVQARPAIPALVAVLRTQPLEQNTLSHEILAALESTGVSLHDLLAKAIDGGDEILTAHVCFAVQNDPTKSALAIKSIESRMGAADPAVRRGATGALGLMGVSDPAALALLSKATRDKDDRVAYRAVASLGHLRPVNDDVVKELLRLIKTDSTMLRYRAIVALAEIGPPAKSALPTLTSIASHGKGPISMTAASAAKSIKGEKPPPVPETLLSGGLPSPITQEPSADLTARSRLAEVPAASTPGILNDSAVTPELIRSLNLHSKNDAPQELLVKALDHQDAEIRFAAAERSSELGSHASSELVTALGKAIHDKDPRVRDSASQSLAKAGTLGMPVLVNAVASPEREVRLEAVQALRSYDRPLTTEALIALRDALTDADPSVRTQAAITLGMAKASPRETIPVLIETLKGSDVSATVSATVALARMDMDALKPLMAALRDPNPSVRTHAVTALGLMDPPPIEAEELIRELLKDENLEVRGSAQQALASFEALSNSPAE